MTQRRTKKASSPPRFATLAKLTHPTPKSVYERTRSFKLLDQARKRSLVWITGPAGSGKTTLVASYLASRKCSSLWYQIDQSDADVASFFYCLGQGAKSLAGGKKMALPLLTPEYRASLPVFTANYFRSLFERMKTPGVLVFDNYQDAGPVDSPLHEILAQGIEQIPVGINVIVVSREEPPAAYARLRANEKLSLIGWDEMRLTEDESNAIAKGRDPKERFSRAMLKDLHRETQGWVAGLVLLIEQTSQVSLTQGMTDHSASQPVFNYFAVEIFRRSSKETQSFLLETAFIPKVSVTMAQALTGEKGSEAILKDLARRNYFTLKHGEGSYEYHPLFRAFLQSLAAETYSPEEIKTLKARSAVLLAQAGDIPTAVFLFEQVHEWEALLKIILEQAPVLAAQGRTLTIEAWLAALPPTFTADNPWALYWKGVCQIAFSPPQARVHFERAFALFEKQRDASPLYLAWSGVIESFILEHDNFTPMLPWLDRYRALALNRKPPAPDIETASIFAYVTGLAYAKFDDTELPAFAERAEKLLQQDTDTNRRFTRALSIILYNLWAGNSNSVRGLLDNLAPFVTAPETTPLSRLHWYLYKTIHAGATGALEEAVSAVNEAMALADASGIHLLNFHFFCWDVWTQLAIGNIAAARISLQHAIRSPRRGQTMNQYCHLRAAAFLLHEGDMARALDEGMQAVRLGEGTSFIVNEIVSLVTLAHIYVRQGNADAAWDWCMKARARLGTAHSKVMDAFCLYAEAVTLCRRSEQQPALQTLRRALTLAREIGLVTPSWCHRHDAALLYTMALDAGIEVDYVREVIRKTRLPPPAELLTESWPWHVRVYTLGRFEIFVDDAPLTFSGRTQKKPLELLRILVASGEYGATREKLAQMLWPDTDGDMARANFDMTLYRLRKLLGEESVQTRGDRIVLGSGHCWLDVWAVNQLVDRPVQAEPLATRVRRLLDLYRGPFLDGYDSAAVLAQRQSLQSKFVMAVDDLGQRLEQHGDHQAALEVYLRGIEVDPLAERLYRRLMGCHHALGHTAEALAVYRRCKEMLAELLGVEPTKETEKLHTEIRAGSRGN